MVCTGNTTSLVVLMAHCGAVGDESSLSALVVRKFGESVQRAGGMVAVLLFDGRKCPQHWALHGVSGFAAVLDPATEFADGTNGSKLAKRYASPQYLPILAAPALGSCRRSELLRYIWMLESDIAYTCDWGAVLRWYDEQRPSDLLPAPGHSVVASSGFLNESTGALLPEAGKIPARPPMDTGNLPLEFPSLRKGWQQLSRRSTRFQLELDSLTGSGTVYGHPEWLLPTLCNNRGWCKTIPFEPAHVRSMYHCCPFALASITENCAARRKLHHTINAALVHKLNSSHHIRHHYNSAGEIRGSFCEFIHPTKWDSPWGILSDAWGSDYYEYRQHSNFTWIECPKTTGLTVQSWLASKLSAPGQNLAQQHRAARLRSSENVR